MVNKNLLTWFGLFFLIVTVCLISFSGVSAADRKEIRVGVINSLTGLQAMIGAEQKWAYDQAVADINKKGGVSVKELGKKLPIKLIYADDKSNAADAASAMERLIKVDKIDMGLSSNSTPINVAAATVCDKYKILFANNFTWPEIWEPQNFKWGTLFCFSMVGAGEVPFLIWKSLPEDEKIKRPVLMTQDNQDGQGFGNIFRDWAKKYNCPFVVDEPYAPGSKDYSSYIMKWKAQNADALLYFGTPTDGILLIRQIKEHKMDFKYVHGWMGFWTTEFLNALGKDSNYIIHDAFWTENLPYPGSKELGQRYAKQFKKDSISIGHNYANPQILAMAIEKAGSIESEKVRNAYLGAEFKGTTMGDLKFNEKAMCLSPNFALQWWNSERMPVWPIIKGGWTLKMMPPWDKR